jgi:hypothetical protein
MEYRTFRSSMDLPVGCRSRTRASISSGVSAYYNTSTIRMRPSMTSPGCYGRAVVRSCWTPTHGTRIISDLDPDVASAFIRASLATLTNPYAARHIPAQVRRAGLTLDPDVGSSAFIFSSDMLLRSQVVQRAADDAVESGGLARDVAAAAVGAVHAAAERGEAFAAITVFGFVARKLDGRRAP